MAAISTLIDVADYTVAVRSLITSSHQNTAVTDFKTQINALNDVVADLESNYAAALASPPTDKPAGKFFFDTTNTLMKYYPTASGTLETVVGVTLTQTLTNKTLTAPVLSGSITGTYTLAGTPTLTAPDINAGTADSLTSLSIRDTSAAYDVTLAAVSSTALTAGRILTLDMVNAARTIKLQGNLDIGGAITTANALITSGNNSLTLTTTGATNVTLPTTGTLVTLAGAESLTNKKMLQPLQMGMTWYRLTNFSAFGSASTQVAYYPDTLSSNVGTGVITLSNASTTGTVFTAVRACLVFMQANCRQTSAQPFGIVLNKVDGTTGWTSLTDAERLAGTRMAAVDVEDSVSWMGVIAANDTLCVKANAATPSGTTMNHLNIIAIDLYHSS